MHEGLSWFLQSRLHVTIKQRIQNLVLTDRNDRLIVLSQVGLYHPKFMLHCKQRIQELILTNRTDCPS